MIAATLDYGPQLLRWPVGPDPDECGSIPFWQQPVTEMFAQMPFNGIFSKVRINAWHMDHPEQDARVAAKRWCLEDYQPDTPGYQVADGLTATEIDLAIFPANWQPVYAGPARPLSPEALAHARKALSHEMGHFHQGQCRYGDADPVAQWITQRFRELRPHQAESEYEDWAEVYRACFGANECRGFFSDGKPYTPAPELYALVRTAYWLQGNLAGLPVHDFTPITGGVMYQALIPGKGWRWRYIANNWQGQEYDGQKWISI